MDRSLVVKRRMILVALAILLAGDLGLAFYSWHAATALRRPMASLVADSAKLKLLGADVDRADQIRHNLPATVAECDRFEGSLLPASSGNSSVTAELDDLAKKSGLQIQNVAFRHKELLGRNLTEVQLEASVTGDYASIVKFMNGLQRSHNSYAVESLGVQSEGQNSPNLLRVGLHMKTYFRTAA
jgi:type IV pilus assembly protein PilO